MRRVKPWSLDAQSTLRYPAEDAWKHSDHQRPHDNSCHALLGGLSWSDLLRNCFWSITPCTADRIADRHEDRWRVRRPESGPLLST